jgi:hypothetical protein
VPWRFLGQRSRRAGEPRRARRGAHCVDASSAPSGLNAAAMVERGAGDSAQ